MSTSRPRGTAGEPSAHTGRAATSARAGGRPHQRWLCLRAVTGEPAKVELGAGDSLGPYRIDSLLGEGGMGAVFSATRTDTGERVALKVIKLELAADRLYQQRF